MKENLYIFCNSQNNPNSIQRFNSDGDTTIWIVNPLSFTGTLTKRYHNVYCDRNFMDSDSGRLLVKEIFKGLANDYFSLF